MRRQGEHAEPSKSSIAYSLPIMMVRNSVAWWLITSAWAAGIFYLSTAGFGETHSLRISALFLTFFHLSSSTSTMTELNVILRKLAHLTEYAVFSFLLYRCFTRSAWPQWQPRMAQWCITIAAAYALTDELHQLFVQGRRASLYDFGIDTAGAVVAMLAIQCRSRVSGPRRAAVEGRSRAS